MAERVILVQHGEKERVAGDPGLTATGRRQAQLTAAWLREHGRGGAVRSSPLARARQTAEPIGRALHVAVHLDDRLRERMNWDDPERCTWERFLAEWTRTTHDRAFVPTSGDSSTAAAERVLAVLASVLQAPEEEVVLVTHGGATTDLLRTLLGDDELERTRPRIIAEGVPGCGLTVLQHGSDGWSPIVIASTAHFEATASR